MPTDPTCAEIPVRPKPDDPAASAIEAESARDPLDVLQLFRKPTGGDDLAVFGLTATGTESRRQMSRMI